MESRTASLVFRAASRAGRTPRHPCRLLSTKRLASSSQDGSVAAATRSKESDANESSPHSQPFVNARIEAGEWDPQTRTNPLYRPKFKSRARIISEEDFANRPTVGFSGEFESFQDAMVTLGWIDQQEQKQIYTLYCELQNHAQSKHQVTSHEYVMRVIAQKYNISAERVASIVQLQHNEEQIKQNDPDRKLLTEAADYMDQAIQQEISDAYQTFGLKKPDEFVEDPVGVLGLQESKTYQVVEDVMDVDQLLGDATVREERQARLAIDGHVYIEDKDDESMDVPLPKDTKKLLQSHKKLKTESSEETSTEARVEWPSRADGEPKRPRWQFIAQTINTRELKRQGRKHKSYRNNCPENTLVEEDGELRAANMADVKQTSWKPVRHVMEHTYGGAKKGWLDRTVRGDEEAWGKAPATQPRIPLGRHTQVAKKPIDDVEGEGDDTDDSSSEPEQLSSSESESSGSSDSEESGDEVHDDED